MAKIFEMDNNEWLAGRGEVCSQGFPGPLTAATAIIQFGSNEGIHRCQNIQMVKERCNFFFLAIIDIYYTELIPTLTNTTAILVQFS